MTPLFWQYFLSAEMEPNKSREFLRTLGTLVDPVSALLSWPKLSQVEKARMARADSGRLAKAIERGVGVATHDDYPDVLADVPLSPPALFTWGDRASWHAPKVAIVGTRSASAYGKAAAYKFAEALARAGVTVVSGGALGIDAAAHQGALNGGGRTIAVLGHGIDKVYPASHGPLFQDIRSAGLLVSQFAIGKPSMGHQFLQRNQVIACLSDATLVIEAPQRSGALSTAGAAGNLGRSVFVVPGSIDREGFRGSHGLIRDGASLVDHPAQILEHLGVEPVEAAPLPAVSGDPESEALLEILEASAKSTEALLAETGMEPQELMSILTILELDGRIAREAGGYVRTP